ncbi:hypothetical protein KR222_007333, partial [Zaprionus bogoriensis]
AMPDDEFIYCYDSLYRLGFYWGIITFRLRRQRDGGPRATPLSVCYALAMRLGLVVGFASGIYIKLNDAQMSLAMFSHLSPLVKIIFSWESLSSICTYVHYCITLDGHRRRHIRLLASMQQLDTQVLAQFPHVRWRYERTRSKYLHGTVGLTIAYNLLSLALMFDTTRCRCGYASTILIACTYSWLTSSLGAMGFIHIGLMDYLRLRFRLIMKLLQQQYDQANQADQEAGHLCVQPHVDRLFGHAKRCSLLLGELNAVCGSVAATGIFYDFTHMTCFVYVLCQKILSSVPLDTQYAFLSLHLVVHVYKVIITCTYGHLLRREKHNCMRLLSEYAARCGNKTHMRGRVECFLHWRMHNNHAASIGNSFSCNLALIYVVFNGLANYVIVLVQLLFQLQLKDSQHDDLTIPKDVELIKPIDRIRHQA